MSNRDFVRDGESAGLQPLVPAPGINRTKLEISSWQAETEAPGARAVAAPTRTPANPSQRILVVEDDVDIREINAQVLAGWGYQVDAAEDGAAGWEALHASNFDLLITDQDMPRLSGLELVKKMRCARMTVPVILASGSLYAEEFERQPWLQLAATLRKPFSPHQLLDTVKEVLGAATRAKFGPDGYRAALAGTLRHHLPYQHGGSDA